MTVPLQQLLSAVIQLPLDDLKLHAKALLNERLTHVTQADVDAFTEAVIDAYFIDAYRGRLKKLEETWEVSLDDDEATLRAPLHRLIHFSAIPIIPSLRYRYRIEGEVLVITPDLPTQDDILEQFNHSVDLTEGWLPARYRR